MARVIASQGTPQALQVLANAPEEHLQDRLLVIASSFKEAIMPKSKPRRGKFLKVTATIELDDGSRFPFLKVNGDTIEMDSGGGLDEDTLDIAMAMLLSAVERYFNQPQPFPGA